MKISFLGGTRTVTGSNHLIETKNSKILLDCGLFQGDKELDEKNFQPFVFNPSEIDFLILGHAHIDHSGRIPKLIKDGFQGKIICTKATMDLADIMLKDSAKIQEQDSEWENRKRQRAGKDLVEPLYTIEDAEKAMNYFNPYFYGQLIKLNEEITIRFNDAGHILGSSITEIWIKEDDKETKLVYSVDLGIKNRPILNSPTYIEDADYLIMESTYGDKNHESFEESSKELIELIKETVLNGGTVIIPSFAVGRTQELIYEFNQFFEYDERAEELKNIKFYVDSPMGVNATEAFSKNTDSFDKETKELILKGDHPFEFKNLIYVSNVEDSVALNKNDDPKVIISSSGMANAGRVRHHLKHNLWDPKNSVIFVGYQAQGTLGRLLIDGIKSVKILGEEINVSAKIYKVNGFSAHADQDFLLEWVSHFKSDPKVFLVHGERPAIKALQSLLEHLYKLRVIAPKEGEVYNLDSADFVREEIDVEALKKEIDGNMVEVKDKFKNFVNNLDLNNLEDDDYVELKNKLIEMEHLLMALNITNAK
ncbi:MAG: MBL fold metallo-hydrolase [Tissierellia bacterium]|nr:MBL fold metallo-hydrolase [Tissierellia bacterium]